MQCHRQLSKLDGLSPRGLLQLQMPFDDQILMIYAQRPDATAVSEMERWNRQFGRARSIAGPNIAVFGDDRQNCLKLYFGFPIPMRPALPVHCPSGRCTRRFEPEVIRQQSHLRQHGRKKRKSYPDAVHLPATMHRPDSITDYLQDLTALPRGQPAGGTG